MRPRAIHCTVQTVTMNLDKVVEARSDERLHKAMNHKEKPFRVRVNVSFI